MGLFDGFGSLLGLGNNNSQTVAQGVPIMAPTTVQQANDAYGMTQNGLAQQNALAQALAAQNGIGNQSSVFNQLQGVANGTGPNPAQAMLNQATGQNVAGTAALMAGARGSSANPGLIARLAAQQGANTQQQAAGQGATLQANQSLGALGQMGNIAGQQVGQQIGAVGNYNQFAQNEQGQLLNSIAQQNNANVGMQSNLNNNNMSMAQTNANNSAKFLSGGVNAAGGALAKLFYDGGMVGSNPKTDKVPDSDRFEMPEHMKKIASIFHPEMMAAGGAMVPGQAEVKGDSPKNDKVPAMLSPKEIVLPRSITLSKDAPEKAKSFVQSLLDKQGEDFGDEDDFKQALKKAISSRKKKVAA